MVRMIVKFIAWFTGLFRRPKVSTQATKRKADKRDKYGRKCAMFWNSSVQGTYHRSYRKVGRNEFCPCDSGFKHKKCHGVGV